MRVREGPPGAHDRVRPRLGVGAPRTSRERARGRGGRDRARRQARRGSVPGVLVGAPGHQQPRRRGPVPRRPSRERHLPHARDVRRAQAVPNRLRPSGARMPPRRRLEPLDGAPRLSQPVLRPGSAGRGSAPDTDPRVVAPPRLDRRGGDAVLRDPDRSVDRRATRRYAADGAAVAKFVLALQAAMPAEYRSDSCSAGGGLDLFPETAAFPAESPPQLPSTGLYGPALAP